MFDLYVFTFHDDGRIYRALSLLSPEQVDQHGLPTEAVLGEINALLPTMTPDQFEPNEAFLRLLHQIVKNHAAELPTLQEQAKTQGTGYVYVVDNRAKESANIQTEDVIGQFEVSRGEIRINSYKENPNYQLLTDLGPIQLPQQLSTIILSHITQTFTPQAE